MLNESENIEIDVQAKFGVGAFYQARVMKVLERAVDGSILSAAPVTEWTDPTHNLVLPAGFSENMNWSSGNFGGYCHAGTGTTPNSVVLDGTYSQTGTTLTRVSGSGTFVSGNVNDFVKYGTGERAKITAFTNGTTVTVDRAQSVAATTLTVYDCSRTVLDTWVKSSNTDDGTSGFQGFTSDTDAGTTRYWYTKNFTVETVARTYTEVGVATAGLSSSTLFSRAVLDTPVNVDVDQFLQLRVDLVMTVGNCRTATPVTMNITGWPYPYTITDITSNGTYWDVTTSINHHYAVGRPITISNALPVTQAISSISSTATTITVNTATAHGRSNGDSVTLAGVTPSGYNGTWTIANVVDADTYEITSPINLGAGTGGTSRLSTPGTWYNGTHTIASIPAANKIRITNATSIAQAGSGTMVNNLNCSAQIAGHAFYQGTGNVSAAGCFDMNYTGVSVYYYNEANLKTITYGTNVNITGGVSGPTMNRGTYTAADRSRVYTAIFNTATMNISDLRQIGIGTGAALFFTFEERQRKDNGFQLVFNYTLSWEPDLA